MKTNLPVPNAEESAKWNKVEYFKRMYDSGPFKSDFGLDEMQFAQFIHHSYESFIHNNKVLQIGEFKKMIK